MQLYRSRAIRLKNKHDLDSALKTLSEGCQCLLKNGYEAAGAELSEFFIDILMDSSKTVDMTIRTMINEIDSCFATGSPSRMEFLRGCVKWTISCSTRELGDPMMQTKLGECLWETKDKTAIYHFTAGESPAALHMKIQEKYPTVEDTLARDRAITTGIVNFLALENLRDANELMYTYTKTCKEKGFPVDSELLTFCSYILQTARRDAAPLFKQLVNVYASHLDYDDAVPGLLTGPIAIRLFGIKPKVNPMMSMLQTMLS